jgi:ribonuclease P/MRP protein subunit POP5
MVRFKNRYLTFKINTKHMAALQKISLDSPQLSTCIKDAIISLFGNYGMGYLGMAHSIKYYRPEIGWGIIRSSREGYRKAWAAITFIKEIKGISCSFQIIHVSATIKQSQRAALEYLKSLKANKEILMLVREDVSKLQD